MGIKDWVGRDCSLGFMSGEPVWIDGIFLGVSVIEIGGEAVRVLVGVKAEKSETWIDSDAFIGIELKPVREKVRQYKPKNTAGESNEKAD